MAGQYSNMIDRAWAEAFAADWIASWNAHDLDRILAHYADDVEMTSPLIAQRGFSASSKLQGKDAVRAYWRDGLARSPDLHFILKDVFSGVDAIVIVYESVTAKRVVAERIRFNADQLGVSAEALHGPVA